VRGRAEVARIRESPSNIWRHFARADRAAYVISRARRSSFCFVLRVYGCPNRCGACDQITLEAEVQGRGESQSWILYQQGVTDR